jgi:hypothetical protein
MTNTELKKLQASLLRARVELAKAKELEEKIKQRVLDINTYIDEETGERITSPKTDYTMSDTDFLDYIDKSNALFASEGITKDYDLRYTAAFERALRDAKDALIDACAELVPTKLSIGLEAVRKHWKYRKELIEVNMRLVL